jgi:hypothetical protein
MNPLAINPIIRACKKYVHDLAPEFYTEDTELMMDRLGPFLLNQKDAETFISMVARIYSSAYTKATQDIQEKLIKENIRIKIVPPKN